jgi:glycosyltransferase involved in cell wall biosynthesis
MTKKKITFIHHCGTKSGAGNSLKTLIQNLDTTKYDISILCPKGSALKEFLKISDCVLEIPELPEIVSISGYRSNYLRILKAILLSKNLKKVLKIVLQINPDIVHLNEISLTPLAKILKKSNLKVIMHARLVLDYKTPLLNKYIVSQVNKFSDAVICIDESVRNMLKEANNTTVVYNSYQFDEPNIAEYPNNKFIVLFLANLIRYKGVFDLVKAANLLKEEKNLEIHIAGGNSRPDIFFTSFKGKVLNFLGLVKNNKKLLEEEIELNGLNSLIKLIGNISNIQEKIMDSSINIFPSYMNGPSRSIFECGVLGRPSIISLHSKVEDVVEDGITGFIIDEKSPDQIANAILKIKDSKDLLREMGANAKRKYIALNNPITNAMKVQEVYDNLLNKI